MAKVCHSCISAKKVLCPGNQGARPLAQPHTLDLISYLLKPHPLSWIASTTFSSTCQSEAPQPSTGELLPTVTGPSISLHGQVDHSLNPC